MLPAFFFVVGALSAVAGWLLSRQVYTNPKVYTSKWVPPVAISGKRVPADDLDGRLFVYSLMCLGMAESCAMFGLCGSLVIHSKPFLFAMIAICLVSWALQFPRYKTFEQKVKLGDR